MLFFAAASFWHSRFLLQTFCFCVVVSSLGLQQEDALLQGSHSGLDLAEGAVNSFDPGVDLPNLGVKRDDLVRDLRLALLQMGKGLGGLSGLALSV